MRLHLLAALMAAALASQAAAQTSSTDFYGWATPYGGHTVRAREPDSRATAAWRLLPGRSGSGSV